MGLPRMRSLRASTRGRVALWTALATGWILPSIGCQVEYAGMTLPSGRYMHDDVQYFPSGPDFPWANTQAATQRARMRAMGIEPPPVGTAGVAPGTPDAARPWPCYVYVLGSVASARTTFHRSRSIFWMRPASGSVARVCT